MWLINTQTLVLKAFINPPPYAILSHQWEADNADEVSFQDMRSKFPRTFKNFRRKIGYRKIQKCCQLAQREGLDYAWVDTCCINKESSAELSEAINSMYKWYSEAKVCYAFLRDVQKDDEMVAFTSSKWFTRGWTLQELIAPKVLAFYDQHWRLIGTKTEMARKITDCTGIAERLLHGFVQPGKFNVAERMRWAGARQTTRVEDRAYCLMGIFNVNMPLLYGEGDKAFMRLQEEIIRRDADHTIFTWTPTRFSSGLLATAPEQFVEKAERRAPLQSRTSLSGSQPFQMTNRGLSIRLVLEPWSFGIYVAWLDCISVDFGKNVGIYLKRLRAEDQYTRVLVDGQSFHRDAGTLSKHKYFLDIRARREVDLYVISIADSSSSLWEDAVIGFRVEPDFDQNLLLDPDVPFNPEERTSTGRAFLHRDGIWDSIFSAKWEDHILLKEVMFGFDFDFNPVCIIRHTNTPDDLDEIEDFRVPLKTQSMVSSRNLQGTADLRRNIDKALLRLIFDRHKAASFVVRRLTEDHNVDCAVIVSIYSDRYGVWCCAITDTVVRSQN